MGVVASVSERETDVTTDHQGKNEKIPEQGHWLNYSKPAINCSSDSRRQFTVLPHARGASRLWIDRFLAKKQRQAESTAGSLVPRPDPVPKRMSDSYVEEYIAFKTDPNVREEYVNQFGNIRIGKVLENLDALAGSIAYLHCDDGRDDTQPLTIVTAGVERIDMLQRIPPDQDIKLSGHVSYVGKSSMEVSLTVETVPEGVGSLEEDGPQKSGPEHKKGDVILTAKFTMVARDPETYKSAPVNQLSLETDEEREIFRLGAERKARKQAASLTELSKKPPSVEEMYLIHGMYLDLAESVKNPQDIVWMKDTIQRTLVMCMPQDRNIHNNIFGGYLMRLAYELAYSTGILYARRNLLFVALADITFRKPVPIGSLLSLKAQAVYASPEDGTFQIKVRADVLDALKGTRETTNTFHFTFAVASGGDGGALRKVVPRSYEESMRYIEGRRVKKAAEVEQHHQTALNLA
ncbi:Acyl-coenzyme A thioesterase 9, mitochondrial [Borealophlyctis nickersoniae]|nr:Acyl-coenzyme A thioesterase 9, mitochondrial [Borealophlyctis nickersoniae]